MLRGLWESNISIGVINEQIFDSSRPFVIQGEIGSSAHRAPVSGDQRLTFPGPCCHIASSRHARDLRAAKLALSRVFPPTSLQEGTPEISVRQNWSKFKQSPPVR